MLVTELDIPNMFLELFLMASSFSANVEKSGSSFNESFLYEKSSMTMIFYLSTIGCYFKVFS